MARCPLCKSSIEYLEPRVSTHCLAKFLEKRLSNGSPQARDAHVLECVERLDAVANGNDDGLKCAICAKSLAHLNAQRRAQHADRCGTKLDKAHGGNVAGAVFFCVVCDENLSERDESYRTRHLKRCAATRNLAPKNVRQLVDARSARQQERPNSEFDALMQMSVASTSAAVNAVGVLERNASSRRAKAAPPLSKRRRERSPLTLEEEDFALARALSLSEATAPPIRDSPPPPPPRATTPPPPPPPLLSPQLPSSRFAQPHSAVFWSLNAMSQASESQMDTLARITADIVEPTAAVASVVDSPRGATLSQLVREATAESPRRAAAAPQDDDRPERDDAVDAVAPERAALLVECDALVQDRRELMLARCGEWQRLIELERLECLRDIVALQRARDEQLAELAAPSTP